MFVISPSEAGGGAEMVAADLFRSCRDRGLRMRMVVGRKTSDDPDVIELPHDRHRSAWARTWLAIATGLGRPKLRNLGEPVRWLRRFLGREDMGFPASSRLFDLIDEPVDVVHAHNLHGGGSGFFDLRALPAIANRVPLILTLHDAWLLAGHCAHSFDCERWQTGCGRCPDLSIPESIRRDASAANFAFKQHVFSQCRLHLASPSRWLMDRAERSLLAPAIENGLVIPNGVDLGLFTPGDRRDARQRLGLEQDADILLTVGNRLRSNIWRDYETTIAAAQEVARGRSTATLLLGLGEGGARFVHDGLEVELRPHQPDREEVSAYYAAADIYVHGSRADTFPTAVLEAMACGRPVVASSVGGISEQVVHGETGFLVPPGDARSMATAIASVLDHPDQGRRLGNAAVERVRRHFSNSLMVDRYLELYRHLMPGAR